MISDRRTVGELTIEELEQILIVKRRQARAERMRRLREIGRLPAEAALPSEDLAPVGADREPEPAVDNPEEESPRERSFEVAPLGGRKRRNARRNRPRGGRGGRVRDKFLLLLEVGAMVGLVVVVVVSLQNI